MKFLVVTKAKMSPPPEMALGLLNAVDAWAEKYKSNGKLEQIWGFAGLQGGGGIGNVGSLEELNEVMAEFPWAPFSDTEIYGLVDFETTQKHQRRAMEAMAPQSK